MRGYALFVTAILVVPSGLSAQSDEIPTWTFGLSVAESLVSRQIQA